MTPEETVVLVRCVRAACPSQHLDEYTPDAWHELLSDITFDDAREGLRRVARRQPFVAPSEIRAEVRAIRSDRLQYQPPAAPPADLTGTPGAYLAQLRQAIAAVADGKTVQRALSHRPAAGPPPEYLEAREQALSAYQPESSNRRPR